jgi:hypothetical protein
MKIILKNIWTTLAGAFAGVPIIMSGIQTHDVQQIISGFGVLLVGLLSKDATSTNN